jgi:hypothetical protein
MPTYIAFSGAKDDFIYVEEKVEAVLDAMDKAARSGSSLSLTQVPGPGQAFESTAVYVNHERVAFVRNRLSPTEGAILSR